MRKTCGAWRRGRSHRKNSNGRTHSFDPLPISFIPTSRQKEPQSHRERILRIVRQIDDFPLSFQTDDEGKPFIVVGGHAVNYWASLYLQLMPWSREVRRWLNRIASYDPVARNPNVTPTRRESSRCTWPCTGGCEFRPSSPCNSRACLIGAGSFTAELGRSQGGGGGGRGHDLDGVPRAMLSAARHARGLVPADVSKWSTTPIPP